MMVIWITLLLFISSTYTIQTSNHRSRILRDQHATSSRNYRHIVPLASPDFDWKHGLREATIQTLLRERLPDHHLRKRIFSAPFLGKQDKASPFGDIALLARGQLYANFAGYIFVQDPYQNDCDECHNVEQQSLRERCVFNHCQIWHARNDNQLLALWSIKRIRHRSLKEGHSKLELEYKIAPVGWSYSREKYLTREGAFNYDIPGHVFILKNSETYQNQFNDPQIDHFKHGVIVAQAPDGRKYVLHNFPSAIFTPETPRFQAVTSFDSMLASTTATKQYTEEDPKKLYQDLLEALHKKTSLTPHRFSPPSTNIATTGPQTTLVTFPTGQAIPITEPITPSNTPGYVTIRFPETSSFPTKQTTLVNHPIFKPPENQDRFIPTSPHIQKTTTHLYMTQPKITMPPLATSATTSVFAPSVTYPQTTSGSTFIRPQYSDVQKSKFTPQYTTAYMVPTTEKEVLYQKPEDSVNTNLPVKTTYHFFAAEEESSTKPANTHLTGVLLHTTPLYSETKETTGHHLTTQNDFRTSSSRRPGNVVKVTTSAQVSSASEESVRPTKQTSEVPSTLFEPSTNYYTTKPPPTHFTHPITVLEDSSEDNINSAPSTEKEATTLFQTATTVASEEAINTATETKVSSKLTSPFTSQSIPTSEMTYGFTTNMHLGPKTTQAMYFASEDSSETHSTIGKDTAVPFITSTVTKVPTTQPTKTESTPKRIITNISADGKVSVKTTPINAQFELFGATKTFSKRPKPTQPLRVSSTEPSNFLVEEGVQNYKSPLYKNSLKDYSEDDIFGPTRSTHAHLSKTTKKYTMSDIEEALFDRNSRKSKAVRNLPITTAATASNVVFSNYFEAVTTAMTTEPPPTTLSTKFSKASVAEKIRTRKIFNTRRPRVNFTYKKNERNTAENNISPVTSQSYLTSISYEVNKGKVKKVAKNKSYEEFTTEYSLENEKNSNPTKSEKQSDGNIDNFALRLVGQAKSVEYLENTLTTTTVASSTNKNEKSSKKPKYNRRRSYVPRSKRPVKKGINKTTSSN